MEFIIYLSDQFENSDLEEKRKKKKRKENLEINWKWSGFKIWTNRNI